MKKRTVIDIAAFVIPAILAFSSYSYGETVNRIMYAVAGWAILAINVAEVCIVSNHKKQVLPTITSKRVFTFVLWTDTGDRFLSQRQQQ